MPRYYPKSQIKPNLYTNGGEYTLIDTGEIYKGYYFKTSTGKDDSHALADRSEATGVSKHECHAHHF